jgi:signal transduction histidine kinase
VKQPTILIISDAVEFSRVVTCRWQSERTVPAFTLMGGDLCQELDTASFDLAIVGAVRSDVLPEVFKSLESAGSPVVHVCSKEQSSPTVSDARTRVMALPQYEGWLDALVLLAQEALHHREALERAERAQEATAGLQRQATLGRYMLEMRHTLNNTLTSVLGNAELLLLEPGSLSAGARSQIETVRNMALRMHEIMQRFSSLEKELSVVEKQVEKENRAQAAIASA